MAHANPGRPDPSQNPPNPKEGTGTADIRVYRRGRWWYIDLRSLGGPRTTMRDPAAPGWPEAGPRTEDERLARTWRAAYIAHLQAELASTEERETGNFRSLGAAADAFYDHRVLHHEPSTASGSRTALTHLREALGDGVRPAEISSRQLQDVIDGFLRDDYEPSTVRNTRNHWSVFFGWLDVDPNPVRRTTVPAPDEREKKAWDARERQRIRDAADSLDARSPSQKPSRRLLVEVLFCMGPRVQEAAAVRWERIDDLARTARLTEQVSRQSNKPKPLKGAGPRTTVILPEWWEVHRKKGVGLILADKDEKPVPARKLYDLVAEVLVEAGVKEVGEAAHQFRHTYAFQFLDRGGTMEQLQKVLGHEDIRTTQRYYDHWTSEHASKAGVVAIYGSTRSIRRLPRMARRTA